MKIELTNFVKRQWKSDFSGTKMNNVNIDEFISIINRIYSFNKWQNTQFDFCKYLFINNDIDYDIKLGVIPINHTIYPYIQSGYFSRTEEELSVLSRWVKFPPNSFNLPKAKYIGLVLYTREQLYKEYKTTTTSDTFEVPFELSKDCEYGIVSIMGLSKQEMEPMPPITHLRNALGKEFGGNGEPINVEEYQKSVEFWNTHILVK